MTPNDTSAPHPDARAEALDVANRLESSARAGLLSLPIAEAVRAIRLLAERTAPTPEDREALIAALDDQDNWHYTGARTVFLLARAADALIAAGWHR